MAKLERPDRGQALRRLSGDLLQGKSVLGQNWVMDEHTMRRIVREKIQHAFRTIYAPDEGDGVYPY